jgi:hypothetical protein
VLSGVPGAGERLSGYTIPGRTSHAAEDLAGLKTSQKEILQQLKQLNNIICQQMAISCLHYGKGIRESRENWSD